MSDKLQPSSDARATAIAVAYQIFSYSRPQDINGADWSRKQAEMIAELSQTILLATEAVPMAEAMEKMKKPKS